MDGSNVSNFFIGRTDTEAEAPILWSPDAKSQLTGKDPDAGKDGGQEEKAASEGEMVGWHHQFNGHEFERTQGDSEGRPCSSGLAEPLGERKLGMDDGQWTGEAGGPALPTERGWETAPRPARPVPSPAVTPDPRVQASAHERYAGDTREIEAAYGGSQNKGIRGKRKSLLIFGPQSRLHTWPVSAFSEFTDSGRRREREGHLVP